MKWTGEPNTATCHCSDCSYTNTDIVGERCLIDLINDALELLKEQVKQQMPVKATTEATYWAICEGCGETFRKFAMPAERAKHCPACGRKIEWMTEN